MKAAVTKLLKEKKQVTFPQGKRMQYIFPAYDSTASSNLLKHRTYLFKLTHGYCLKFHNLVLQHSNFSCDQATL